MFDLIVTLARALEIAASECRDKATKAAPQSIDATVNAMLAEACTKAAAELTGAAVCASRV